MPSLPVVAIVGRPNVGKSTLFNRLVGKKLALVDDLPGVTRDRREGQGRLFDLDFRIVDTAGFEEADPDTLPGRMRAQTEAALGEADVVLFLIDARAGVTPLDATIAQWLRAQPRPVILVANKVEGRASSQAGLSESYELGLDEPVAISAEHGEGLVELYDALRPYIDAFVEAHAVAEAEAEGDAEDPAAPLKLAIIGRPNAGKSTLINQLLGEDRMITGPEAGITRDSISIDWEWPNNGDPRPVRLVDTAGLRRKAKIKEKLEKLSAADTRRAIDFAEVVVLLLDATLGLEAQDLRIADLALEEGRAFIIALNKWDVAADQSKLFQGVQAALEEGLAQIKGVPLLTVSGKTGKGLDTMLKVAFEQREKWSRRVGTSALNRWFERTVAKNPPPAPGGRRIKLRYITQANTRPPAFVVFGNRLDELPESYRRYLINAMRGELDLAGVPIRLNMRSRANPFDR